MKKVIDNDSLNNHQSYLTKSSLLVSHGSNGELITSIYNGILERIMEGNMRLFDLIKITKNI